MTTTYSAMDYATSERGRNKSKRELGWFYPKDMSIHNLCATKQNLRTLIIIGQTNVSSFSAISELTLLQELWIVECGIKEVPPLRKCAKLEKLYLYSNEIEYIPHLSNCSRLKILSLSGNSIENLKNLRKLAWIEEIDLANNKIDRVDKIFLKKLRIHYINFSGNNLCCLKDIKNLAMLPKLNAVVFVDPLYGKCPLVNYCNYRFYVINSLPCIKRLDHYSISDEERHHAHKFYKRQLMFYNMQLHKHLNVYLESVKNKEYQHESHISCLNEQLCSHKMKQDTQSYSEHEDCSAEGNIILQIDTNNKKFAKWKEMAAIRLKIQQQQSLLSMSYYGNISFTGYSAEDAVAQLSQKILEESLCPVIKNNKNLVGVKVHEVTKVINKEIDAARVTQNEEQNLQTDKNVVLRILQSPLGVTRHQSWPFPFYETDFFTEKEMIVTDCLASADSVWLTEMNLREKNIDQLRSATVPEKRRICVLIQTPCTVDTMEKKVEIPDRHHSGSNTKCHIIRLSPKDIRNPIFVVEYEYISENINLVMDNDLCKSYPSIDTSNFLCALSKCKQNRQYKTQSNVESVGNGNIDSRMLTTGKTTQKMKYIHLSNKLQLSPDILKSATTIKELCITHCLLTILPIGKPLKHLSKLNLSSNLIATFEGITQGNLPALNYLDLSNNLISSLQEMGQFRALQEFYCSHNKLSTLATIENIRSWHMLEIIDLCSNPIDEDELYRKFIVFHLPNIQYISTHQVKDSDIFEASCIFSHTLNKYILSSMYAEDYVTNITQLSIVNCSLKKVDLVSDSLPHLQSLDLSQNKITCILGLHSFLHLHTLCLSYNCLESLDDNNIANQNHRFPNLATLFLDHNCIKTLLSIKPERLPAIKHLILNHNYIQSVYGINQCFTLETLILDYNKIDVLKEHDFHKNNNINILSLENNKICSLLFIKSLQKLEKFYVANNNIANEDELRYLTLPKNLKEITLEGNSCRIEKDDILSIIENFELKAIEA